MKSRLILTLAIVIAIAALLSSSGRTIAGGVTEEQAREACWAQKQFEFNSCVKLNGGGASWIGPCLTRANRIFDICMAAHGYPQLQVVPPES